MQDIEYSVIISHAESNCVKYNYKTNNGICNIIMDSNLADSDKNNSANIKDNNNGSSL